MDNIKPFNVTKKNPTHAVIEIFGGDNDLDSYIEKDMQEMLADMPEDMSVLCLVDYLGKPAEVVELTRVCGKILIESLDEINTGDPEKLAEFLTRSLATYGRETKIAIGFWSHGTGISDAYVTRISDTTIKYEYQVTVDKDLNIYDTEECHDIILDNSGEDQSADGPQIMHARVCTVKPKSEAHMMVDISASNDVLTNRETEKMLETAFYNSGFSGHKVNMIFSDTCLNGMVELLHEFAKYADMIVASEDLEPGDGWDYKLWFKKMATEPPIDSASWAKQAVAAFEESYKNKTDFHPCTLGAFTTDNILVQTFKELIEAVDAYSKTGWHWMRDAREHTQRFDIVATYDLFHFTQNLLIVLEKYGVNAEKVKEKAQTLADAFQKCRVHSVALGEKVRNYHGLGFWFPYEKAIFMKDVESYSGLSFDKDTGWTTYLKKYYLAE